MRHTRFILCNCKELDINYNHSFYFTNVNKQIEYFISKSVYTINDCYYHRKDSSIKIDKSFDELQFVNYVVSRNEEDGKYYFYFVHDRVYVNDEVTLLILKLDVIQTYLFDMDLNTIQSLVDRYHCNRFNGELPDMSNVNNDEGIEVGEYVEKSRTTIFDYSNMGGYIVTSSDKLTSRNGGSTGGSTGGNNNNSYLNGYCSENGFVLIKSMEGFSSLPYDIGDGTRTIGYGVTEVYEPNYFNQLLPSCTEQQASEVFGKLLYDKYSSYVYNQLKQYGKDMTTVKQCEFDAFVSFYYNTGTLGSRQIFIDYVNGVDKETIYKKWLTSVIMSGTQFEEGLRDRRLREATAFRDGVYNFKKISDLSTGGYITDNDGKGYIPEEYQYKNENSLGEQIVETARSLIGKPYVWGGNYPPLGNDNGTDCSGLCQWAYYMNGKSITRTTYTQIKEGIEVSKEDLQIGDLVFSNFSSPGVPEHVFLFSGINDGNYMCVEAPNKNNSIRERVFTWTDGMRARRLL